MDTNPPTDMVMGYFPLQLTYKVRPESLLLFQFRNEDSPISSQNTIIGYYYSVILWDLAIFPRVHFMTRQKIVTRRNSRIFYNFSLNSHTVKYQNCVLVCENCVFAFFFMIFHKIWTFRTDECAKAGQHSRTRGCWLAGSLSYRSAGWMAVINGKELSNKRILMAQ